MINFFSFFCLSELEIFLKDPYAITFMDELVC